MSIKPWFVFALTAAIASLSSACFFQSGEAKYGYVGEGDARIDRSMLSNYMNEPRTIENTLRAELYRNRDPRELLTAEYLTARGASCIDRPIGICNFRGEFRLRHTSKHFGPERAASPYQRVFLIVEIHLNVRPQKFVAVKTETWSPVLLPSLLPNLKDSEQ